MFYFFDFASLGRWFPAYLVVLVCLCVGLLCVDSHLKDKKTYTIIRSGLDTVRQAKNVRVDRGSIYYEKDGTQVVSCCNNFILIKE